MIRLCLTALRDCFAALCSDQRASGCIFRNLIMRGENLFIVSEKSPPTTSFPQRGKEYPVDISLRRRFSLIKAVQHKSTAKIKLRRTPRRKGAIAMQNAVIYARFSSHAQNE